ncbi:MAG: FtsX-like permease family protein [Candidatus Latescibacteria bacterium]|nr:FtsX-like permease family protein [Candidatus Latescibacterota bacterium]
MITTGKALAIHLNLLKTAAENVLRSKMRSAVVLVALVAILFPFITGIAISEGVRQESMISVENGADLYVTYDQYGKTGPVPITWADSVLALPAVKEVVPRVIGRVYLQDKLVVLVGIDPANYDPGITIVEGRLPEKPFEAVIGRGIADYLKLDVGQRFTFSSYPDRLFMLVGIFKGGTSIWSSDLMLTSFEAAGEVFRQPELATDLLLSVRSGYETGVSEQLAAMNPRFRMQDRALIQRYFDRGFRLKEGIFTAIYTVAFALAIPALLVVSGLGLSDRRREIGVLKATGWHTSEVLEMVVWENLIISLISAPVAVLLSIVWIEGLRGTFIAQFFISEAGLIADFDIPAEYAPLPVFLSVLFALLLTLMGSIYSSWRSAIVPPAEAMK